jgi:hypothetical protein
MAQMKSNPPSGFGTCSSNVPSEWMQMSNSLGMGNSEWMHQRADTNAFGGGGFTNVANDVAMKDCAMKIHALKLEMYHRQMLHHQQQQQMQQMQHMQQQQMQMQQQMQNEQSRMLYAALQKQLQEDMISKIEHDPPMNGVDRANTLPRVDGGQALDTMKSSMQAYSGLDENRSGAENRSTIGDRHRFAPNSGLCVEARRPSSAGRSPSPLAESPPESPPPALPPQGDVEPCSATAVHEDPRSSSVPSSTSSDVTIISQEVTEQDLTELESLGYSVFENASTTLQLAKASGNAPVRDANNQMHVGFDHFEMTNKFSIPNNITTNNGHIF